MSVKILSEGDENMSDNLITKTPYTSPDALRTFLQLSKQMYDQYTKESYGFKDSNGLQYVGTVKNFGSEMLIESQKMMMNRPPFDFHYMNQIFSYFFQLKKSDFIDTYEQQNMMAAYIKPNTMTSNHTYQLKFTNATEVYILRAEADGDFYTRKSKFIKTYDNPILLIDDSENPLYIDQPSNGDHHAVYYFALNSMTESFIDSYEDGTMITIDLRDYAELPFIWICSTLDEYDPVIRWIGNVDRNGNPLLTIGTGGQHRIELYPYIYGEDNIPASDPDGVWYVKAYGEFYKQPQAKEKNYSVDVTKIEFLRFTGDPFHIPPTDVQTITWDAIYTKITLVNMEPDWVFHTPVEGDYDYDGATYNNPTYALIPLEYFTQNISTETNPNPACIPMFHVIFSNNYFLPFEKSITRMRSGIHIDYTSDHSDHSVIKKYGVVYNLCDFDGLPPYYNYNMDRLIHHAHVELYTIRDDVNRPNLAATKKQTAAIIIDSAVPQNDINDIIDDMEPVIIYSYDRAYVSDESKIVSTVNYLSNIAYVSDNHFGDHTMAQFQNNKQFVYHGNRRFSLGMISYDPEMEFGRGYLISNDSTKYENNASAKYPKPESTVARICDIPTSFAQLQNISGIAPTLVIDEKYTRQTAAFTNDEWNKLWNQTRTDQYVLQSTRYNYLPTIETFVNEFDVSSFITQCGKSVIAKSTIRFGSDEYTVSIANGGSNYDVDDEFGFNIGGLFFLGIVDTVDSGAIATFHFTLDPSIPGNESLQPVDIPMMNFDSRVSSFPLNTVSGNGEGASLTWEIDSTVWEQHIPSRSIDPTKANIFTYVWDPARYGVCIVAYDPEVDNWDFNHRIQLTGELDLGNMYYDPTSSYEFRKIWSNVMEYNNLVYQKMISEYETSELSSKNYIFPADVIVDRIVDGTDLSISISNAGLNTWNSFLGIVPTDDLTGYYVLRWNYSAMTSVDNEDTNLVFPSRSNLSVSSYDGSWSGMVFTMEYDKPVPFMYDIMHTTQDTYHHNESVNILSKSVPRKLSDILTLSETDGYPSNAKKLYESNILQYNLYRFDHFAIKDKRDSIRETLESYPIEVLSEKIQSRYGDAMLPYITCPIHEYIVGAPYQTDMIVKQSNTNVVYRATRPFMASSFTDDVQNGNLVYAGTDTRKQDLINYYMSNYYEDSVYDIADVSLFKEKNESITTIPDDKPIGGYVPLIDTFHENVVFGSVHEKAEPLFVFRVDNDSISDLSTFRMYDGTVDISEYTLLILNSQLYTFRNGAWQLYYQS